MGKTEIMGLGHGEFGRSLGRIKGLYGMEKRLHLAELG